MLGTEYVHLFRLARAVNDFMMAFQHITEWCAWEAYLGPSGPGEEDAQHKEPGCVDGAERPAEIEPKMSWRADQRRATVGRSKRSLPQATVLRIPMATPSQGG